MSMKQGQASGQKQRAYQKGLMAQRATYLQKPVAELLDDMEFDFDDAAADEVESAPDNDADTIEPIDADLDFETGEGVASNLAPEAEQPESVEIYLIKRIYEDFNLEEDSDIVTQLVAAVDQWKQGLDPLAGIDAALLPWAEGLFLDLPALQPVVQETPVPEIIFSRPGNAVAYEITLGDMDGLLIHAANHDTARDNGLSDRREALKWVAEFLLEHQKAFFEAPDLQTALLRIRSQIKKDLISYLSAHGVERKKPWVSQVLNQKWMQSHFGEMAIPLNVFFNETASQINILYKAIGLHVEQEQYPVPLTAPDQCVLLKALMDYSSNDKNIRKHYWPELHVRYPGDEEHWIELGIRGPKGRKKAADKIPSHYLAELANQVADALALDVGKITPGKIETIRNEMQRKRK